VTEFDHIVVIAPDLASGLDHVEAQIGLRLPPGGAHPLMGTHNHLVRLGAAAFLEVIAVDPAAAPPARPRWFTLDTPPAAPRLAHWVVRTDDMAALHPRLPRASGPALPVSRGALSWLLTVPEDGALPEGGTFPSVIEWRTDPLPPRAMPDAGLDLLRLDIGHPEPARLSARLDPLFSDPRVVVAGAPAPSLAALVATPGGPKWLR
jgi:hypothetical protein